MWRAGCSLAPGSAVVPGCLHPPPVCALTHQSSSPFFQSRCSWSGPFPTWSRVRGRVGRAMLQDQLACSVYWPGDFGHTGAKPQASTAVEAILLTCCEVKGHSSHELGAVMEAQRLRDGGGSYKESLGLCLVLALQSKFHVDLKTLAQSEAPEVGDRGHSRGWAGGPQGRRCPREPVNPIPSTSPRALLPRLGCLFPECPPSAQGRPGTVRHSTPRGRCRSASRNRWLCDCKTAVSASWRPQKGERTSRAASCPLPGPESGHRRLTLAPGLSGPVCPVQECRGPGCPTKKPSS